MTEPVSLKEAIVEFCRELGVFDPVSSCRNCKCSTLEHIPVKRNDEPWIAACRNCLCDNYEEA